MAWLDLIVAYHLSLSIEQGCLSEAAAPTQAERFIATVNYVHMKQDSSRCVPIAQKFGALEPWETSLQHLLVAPVGGRFLS